MYAVRRLAHLWRRGYVDLATGYSIRLGHNSYSVDSSGMTARTSLAELDQTQQNNGQ